MPSLSIICATVYTVFKQMIIKAVWAKLNLIKYNKIFCYLDRCNRRCASLYIPAINLNDLGRILEQKIRSFNLCLCACFILWPQINERYLKQMSYNRHQSKFCRCKKKCIRINSNWLLMFNLPNVTRKGYLYMYYRLWHGGYCNIFTIPCDRRGQHHYIV